MCSIFKLYHGTAFVNQDTQENMSGLLIDGATNPRHRMSNLEQTKVVYFQKDLFA